MEQNSYTCIFSCMLEVIWCKYITCVFHTSICVCVSHSVMSDSLRPHELEPTRLLCPWNSPSKNTGVDCHSLLQRIFQTQELNAGLPHCRQILYSLSHQGNPFKQVWNQVKKHNWRWTILQKWRMQQVFN